MRLKQSVLGIWLVCVSVLTLTGCAAQPTIVIPPTDTPAPATSTPPQAAVDVTLGGWRISTERLNEVITAFDTAHPDISVRFVPYVSGEYEGVLQSQLAEGTAPDMLYLRSFSQSREYYEAGYLVALNDLPGLQTSFDKARLAPWQAGDAIYGVPLAAVSQGIYYNVDAFNDLGLDIPETWEDLLAISATIEDAGMVAFANGTKDAWPIAETIFMSIVPNFTGGRDGRLAYQAGERCFNDADMTATFQAVKDISQYFPEEHELLGYVDSLQMFVQGKALMWMSGSWDISYFEENAPAFTWSVFAVPAPEGKATVVVFQPDVGIGLNANSEHAHEAKVFLEWVTTSEFAELFANKMVGLYPMHNDTVAIESAYGNAFLSLNEQYDTDIRFVWETLRTGTPSGYALIQDNAAAVIAGTITPQEASDALQQGLAIWFEPAGNCQ